MKRDRERRTPHDATTRLLDMSVVENDRRRLASQLERDRRPTFLTISSFSQLLSEKGDEQVLGGGFGDDSSNSSASSVEDVVVAESEQSSRLRDRTGDDLVRRGVEVLGHERSHEGGGGGALLGRLDHSGAAGADGSEERGEEECCAMLGIENRGGGRRSALMGSAELWGSAFGSRTSSR